MDQELIKLEYIDKEVDIVTEYIKTNVCIKKVYTEIMLYIDELVEELIIEEKNFFKFILPNTLCKNYINSIQSNKAENEDMCEFTFEKNYSRPFIESEEQNNINKAKQQINRKIDNIKTFVQRYEQIIQNHFKNDNLQDFHKFVTYDKEQIESMNDEQDELMILMNKSFEIVKDQYNTFDCTYNIKCEEEEKIYNSRDVVFRITFDKNKEKTLFGYEPKPLRSFNYKTFEELFGYGSADSQISGLEHKNNDDKTEKMFNDYLKKLRYSECTLKGCKKSKLLGTCEHIKQLTQTEILDKLAQTDKNVGEFANLFNKLREHLQYIETFAEEEKELYNEEFADDFYWVKRLHEDGIITEEECETLLKNNKDTNKLEEIKEIEEFKQSEIDFALEYEGRFDSIEIPSTENVEMTINNRGIINISTEAVYYYYVTMFYAGYFGIEPSIFKQNNIQIDEKIEEFNDYNNESNSTVNVLSDLGFFSGISFKEPHSVSAKPNSKIEYIEPVKRVYYMYFAIQELRFLQEDENIIMLLNHTQLTDLPSRNAIYTQDVSRTFKETLDNELEGYTYYNINVQQPMQDLLCTMNTTLYTEYLHLVDTINKGCYNVSTSMDEIMEISDINLGCNKRTKQMVGVVYSKYPHKEATNVYSTYNQEKYAHNEHVQGNVVNYINMNINDYQYDNINSIILRKSDYVKYLDTEYQIEDKYTFTLNLFTQMNLDKESDVISYLVNHPECFMDIFDEKKNTTKLIFDYNTEFKSYLFVPSIVKYSKHEFVMENSYETLKKIEYDCKIIEKNNIEELQLLNTVKNNNLDRNISVRFNIGISEMKHCLSETKLGVKYRGLNAIELDKLCKIFSEKFGDETQFYKLTDTYYFVHSFIDSKIEYNNEEPTHQIEEVLAERYLKYLIEHIRQKDTYIPKYCKFMLEHELESDEYEQLEKQDINERYWMYLMVEFAGDYDSYDLKKKYEYLNDSNEVFCHVFCTHHNITSVQECNEEINKYLLHEFNYDFYTHFSNEQTAGNDVSKKYSLIELIEQNITSNKLEIEAKTLQTQNMQELADIKTEYYDNELYVLYKKSFDWSSIQSELNMYLNKQQNLKSLFYIYRKNDNSLKNINIVAKKYIQNFEKFTITDDDICNQFMTNNISVNISDQIYDMSYEYDVVGEFNEIILMFVKIFSPLVEIDPELEQMVKNIDLFKTLPQLELSGFILKEANIKNVIKSINDQEKISLQSIEHLSELAKNKKGMLEIFPESDTEFTSMENIYNLHETLDKQHDNQEETTLERNEIAVTWYYFLEKCKEFIDVSNMIEEMIEVPCIDCSELSQLSMKYIHKYSDTYKNAIEQLYNIFEYECKSAEVETLYLPESFIEVTNLNTESAKELDDLGSYMVLKEYKSDIYDYHIRSTISYLCLQNWEGTENDDKKLFEEISILKNIYHCVFNSLFELHDFEIPEIDIHQNKIHFWNNSIYAESFIQDNFDEHYQSPFNLSFLTKETLKLNGLFGINNILEWETNEIYNALVKYIPVEINNDTFYKANYSRRRATKWVYSDNELNDVIYRLFNELKLFNKLDTNQLQNIKQYKNNIILITPETTYFDCETREAEEIENKEQLLQEIFEVDQSFFQKEFTINDEQTLNVIEKNLQLLNKVIVLNEHNNITNYEDYPIETITDHYNLNEMDINWIQQYISYLINYKRFNDIQFVLNEIANNEYYASFTENFIEYILQKNEQLDKKKTFEILYNDTKQSGKYKIKTFEILHEILEKELYIEPKHIEYIMKYHKVHNDAINDDSEKTPEYICVSCKDSTGERTQIDGTDYVDCENGFKISQDNVDKYKEYIQSLDKIEFSKYGNDYEYESIARQTYKSVKNNILHVIKPYLFGSEFMDKNSIEDKMTIYKNVEYIHTQEEFLNIETKTIEKPNLSDTQNIDTKPTLISLYECLSKNESLRLCVCGERKFMEADELESWESQQNPENAEAILYFKHIIYNVNIDNLAFVCSFKSDICETAIIIKKYNNIYIYHLVNHLIERIDCISGNLLLAFVEDANLYIYCGDSTIVINYNARTRAVEEKKNNIQKITAIGNGVYYQLPSDEIILTSDEQILQVIQSGQILTICEYNKNNKHTTAAIIDGNKINLVTIEKNAEKAEMKELGTVWKNYEHQSYNNFENDYYPKLKQSVAVTVVHDIKPSNIGFVNNVLANTVIIYIDSEIEQEEIFNGEPDLRINEYNIYCLIEQILFGKNIIKITIENKELFEEILQVISQNVTKIDISIIASTSIVAEYNDIKSGENIIIYKVNNEYSYCNHDKYKKYDDIACDWINQGENKKLEIQEVEYIIANIQNMKKIKNELTSSGYKNDLVGFLKLIEGIPLDTIENDTNEHDKIDFNALQTELTTFLYDFKNARSVEITKKFEEGQEDSEFHTSQLIETYINEPSKK